TPNTPGIAGLKEGVKFVKNIGVDAIYQHERKLTKNVDRRIGANKKKLKYMVHKNRRKSWSSFNNIKR
ncbi:aminotransferase class V, partial [Thermoanaerobacter ethanolicus JW 200]